jgi:hypothetical protein
MGKPLKDVDMVKRTLILKNFLRIFPFVAILGLALGGILGIFIALVVSVVAAIFAEMLSGFIGGSANLLYGVGKSTLTIREQLSGTMSIARNHKMNKRFDKAFLLVEEILNKDPEYSEALLLKAQILWEGFEDADEAKGCLERIMVQEKTGNDPIYRWASTLYKEMEEPEDSSM